jgi:hypothetical protein
MKMSVFLFSAILLCASCSEDEDIIKNEEPMKPNTEIPTGNNGGTDNSPAEYIFTTNSTVDDIISNPAFGDFGYLLFPVDRNVSRSMTLADISSSNVYVWYSHILPEKTVEIINRLYSDAAAGNQIFYRMYSDAEIAADRSKADTGLFLFRGEVGKPFAITNAGGGFMYVGAMHDSFPHSLEISNAGFNAFALIYRPDDPYSDLAKAIEFIHDNVSELGVKADDYSLWGGSAGARMSAVLGNQAYLQQLTDRNDIPQASAVIMQYTGYTQASQYDAPTYVCVGSNDGIASWRTMQNRLQRLSAMGIPTEFHVYEGLGHGFGLGQGTVADGWINDALKFWQTNMKTNEKGKNGNSYRNFSRASD